MGSKYCSACGSECFDNHFPEIVFYDGKDIICEMCSIDYEELDGEIILRFDLQKDGVIDQRTLYHEKQNRLIN